MTINDISPVVYNFNYFTYSPEKQYRDIGHEKTQYTYRLMFFDRGKTNIKIADRVYSCDGGDVVFLLPGEKYTILPADCGFRVVTVFFDFFEGARKELCGIEKIYWLTDKFNKELCSEIVSFSDAECFNNSGVFKGAYSGEKVERLLLALIDGKYSGLFAKSCIMSVLCNILNNNAVANGYDKNAEGIINYIRQNVTSSLSPDTISAKFGYHKNYLNTIIKKNFGITLSDLIRKEKIHYGKMMLSEGKMSCSQVAQELGYYDFSHFYKAFKAETGMSPNSFTKLLNSI